jgi:hypothetical protein
MLDETEIADMRLDADAPADVPNPNLLRKPVQSDGPHAERGADPGARSPQGVITPPQVQNAQEPPPAARQQGNGDVVISDRHCKMLFAIQRSVGISDDECKRRLAEMGYTGHRDHLPKRLFQQALDGIDPEFRFHTREGK